MTESSGSRPDMMKESTAMNDSNGTLETCRFGRDTTNWSIRVDEEGNITYRPRSEFRSSRRRPRHKQWGWWCGAQDVSLGVLKSVVATTDATVC